MKAAISTAPEESAPTVAAAPPRRAGIVAGDAYYTAFGQSSRRGSRFVAGADEDAVTMAVEASLAALARWPGEPAEVGGLFVALGTERESEAPHQQIVREAVGLPEQVKTVAFGSDALAGLDALQAALDAVAGGAIENALVVASEGDPEGERNAGAAALIVTALGEDEGAVELRELGRASALTHERLRSSLAEPREPDFRYLQHRYQGVVTAAIEAASAHGDVGFDELVFSGGSASSQAAVRRELLGSGGAASADFGVAGPLLAVQRAVSELPDRRLGLIVYGGGQGVVLELRAPAALGASLGRPAQAPEGAAAQPATALGPALPLPLESPFFARSWNESLRAEGARCTNCGHVVFPPSQRAICPRCHRHEFRSEPLPREGTVLTWIDNRFLPGGYPDRIVSVLADLGEGVHFWAPMPPESGPEGVEIGDRVELRLRTFTARDGITVYSLKFLPAEPRGANR